MATEKRTGLIA